MNHRLTMGARSLFVCALLALGTSTIGLAQDSTAKADNSKNNSKNNRNSAVTADNAKNNKSDVQLAAAIRKSIVADKTLSTYAHNVKVVVRNGTVTLTGPVRSEDEKKSVASKATEAASGATVNDQMTIAHKKNSKMTT